MFIKDVKDDIKVIITKGEVLINSGYYDKVIL